MRSTVPPALALLAILAACGGRPSPIPESPAAREEEGTEVGAEPEAAPVHSLEDGSLPPAWPDDESRLRLAGAEAGRLELARDAVDTSGPPAEGDLVRVDEAHIVLRVGPVGEWYANDTLYVLIDAATHEPLRAGVYGHSDMGGLGGWYDLRGRLWSDPAVAPGDGRLRCGFDLWAEDEPDEPLFEGWIEIGTRDSSEGLRRDLESFGLKFGS